MTIRCCLSRLQSASASVDSNLFKKRLELQGFELLEDKQAMTVDLIKTAIIELIYSGNIEDMHVRFSTLRKYNYRMI